MGDFVKNEEKKIGFDLSTLSLSELVKVFENISDFLQFLEEKKIVEKVNKK